MPTRKSASKTFMAHDDFCAILESIFGQGWQSRFCELLDLDRSWINRYANGSKPIPKDKAMLVRLLQVSVRNGIPLEDPQGFEFVSTKQAKINDDSV